MTNPKPFPRCLITGASGFVGNRLYERLLREGADVTGVCRSPKAGSPLSMGPALSAEANWASLLQGQDVVIHTAARVHQLKENLDSPIQAYRKVNVEGTLQLAKQAAKAGVKRFVFLSSVKVHGEATLPDAPFRVEQPPTPQDPYGLSKWEAEQGLAELAARTEMEVVIIRPPLVYGPGVKANFRHLVKWINSGVPLPFGAEHNKRSLIALDNLVDFLAVCITHPLAAGQTFLVSDGEDLSSKALARAIASALGKKVHIVPLPACLFKLAGRLLKRPGIDQRVNGSLQVDSNFAQARLDWTPPLSVAEAMAQLASDFKR